MHAYGCGSGCVTSSSFCRKSNSCLTSSMLFFLCLHSAQCSLMTYLRKLGKRMSLNFQEMVSNFHLAFASSLFFSGMVLGFR